MCDEGMEDNKFLSSIIINNRYILKLNQLIII